MTPLHIACKFQHNEAISILIVNGADINASDM